MRTILLMLACATATVTGAGCATETVDGEDEVGAAFDAESPGLDDPYEADSKADGAWLPRGRVAALSITIDDNHAQDHAFWLQLGQTTGARFTWFVITGRVQPMRNAAAAWHGVWDDFRALARAGHEIGSHSHSHNVNIADIKTDVQTASDLIGQNIGRRPSTLAYPDPAADPRGRWKSIVEGMGFTGTRGTVGQLATTKRNANSFSAARGINLDTLVNSHGWAVAHFHNLTPELKTQVTALVKEATRRGVWVAPFGAVANRFPR